LQDDSLKNIGLPQANFLLRAKYFFGAFFDGGFRPVLGGPMQLENTAVSSFVPPFLVGDSFLDWCRKNRAEAARLFADMAATEASDVALEHVAWALSDGQTPREIGRSVDSEYSTPTVTEAVKAVAAAWRQLRREARQ
jgi:hypothetical protein